MELSAEPLQLTAVEPIASRPPAPVGWILFAIMLASAVARVSMLNDDFGRTFEGTVCGPIVCAARNTVRYGLIKTHFGYVENAGEVPEANFTFYSHHPALVPMTMAAGAWIFGDEPWSYRLAAGICSVLTTGLLFIVLTRKFDWSVGLTASFIYAFCPFSWLLSDMPDVVGPHLVFFGVATIECYSRWFDFKKSWWFVLAVISWILCAFSDWPAFYIPPVLAGHYILNRPVRSWWRIAPFAIFSAAVLGFHFWYLTHWGDKSVYDQFFHRINGKTDNGHSIGLADYWNDAIKGYIFHNFTMPVVCLLMVYILSLLALAAHQIRRLKAHDTTLMLLGWGAVHVMIGFQSSHQHLWVWSVVLPGFCAGAALGGRAIWKLLGGLVEGKTVAHGVVAFVGCVFLISSYLNAHAANEMTLTEQPMIYSIKDLGMFIRESVPKDQGVLTSDMTDESTEDSEPALWYYADRQIRNNIRSVDQLDWALGKGNPELRDYIKKKHNYLYDVNPDGSGDYPLYYHMLQAGGPEPLWFVMPAEHRIELPELTAELDRRYAHWPIKGYMLYYLKETPAEQAAKDK